MRLGVERCRASTYGRSVSGVELRQVVGGEDLAHAERLSDEYGQWVRSVLQIDHGISIQDPSESHLLFSDLTDLLQPPSRLYLAVVDGRPLGVAGIKHLDASAAEIKRMYVLPAARGHGVGRELLQRLVSDGYAGGYAVLRLETMTWMTEAVALYRRFGFAEIRSYGAREFEKVRSVDPLAVSWSCV